MRTEKGPEACVAAVGMFDGVHAGHGSLVATLVGEARRRGLPSLVLTFDRHPLEVVRPGEAPRSLCSPREREARLLALGVDRVEFMHFTPELREITGEEFLRRLRERYGVRALVVGFNNHFGADRMDASGARAAEPRTGVSIVEAPPLRLAEIPAVSSTTIREALAGGDVETASRLLGAPYSLEGEVVHGAELGHTLGYPTANLRPSDVRAALPALGVYVVEADIPELGIYGRRGMTNIGRRPSVKDADGSVSIETYIFDFDGDIYGRRLRVHFLRRLRPEMKFTTLPALVSQLDADARAARE